MFSIRVDYCIFPNLYGHYVLRYSVLVVFNNFLLIDATDRSKIISDQKRFFISLSLYPLSFFANTPFNLIKITLQVLSFHLLMLVKYIRRCLLQGGWILVTSPCVLAWVNTEDSLLIKDIKRLWHIYTVQVRVRSSVWGGFVSLILLSFLRTVY